MNVLVVGSGGREHALVWKIRQSPRVRNVYCAPGNPGIAELASCLPIKATAIAELAETAKREKIDLTVVGPEQPLAEGIVDHFEAIGLKIFGPTKRASQLEWSKAFAKEFMLRHNIPTARHTTFTRAEEAEAQTYLQSVPMPIVLKADGLASGKGVVICHERDEAVKALTDMQRQFGPACDRIVVEEFLEGEEASVFAVCDGEEFVTLAPAQDHKRAFDNDRGKNTGGMGAYAPAPIVPNDILRDVEDSIIRPTLKGMQQEGRPYKGCLYVGLMITSAGPSVVEYNCRFGDPETQAVLPLYTSDFVELLEAACSGKIGKLHKRQRAASSTPSAVCVVLASQGYPNEYPTGLEITGLEEVEAMDNVLVFHAGTKISGGTLVTAGGRVLGVTAIHPQLGEAIHDAYEAVRRISFAGMHYRRDIGKKAFVH
ncbi:MAG: phosphoribosylamine--glycine ligase [Ignavibacteria bacterium]